MHTGINELRGDIWELIREMRQPARVVPEVVPPPPPAVEQVEIRDAIPRDRGAPFAHDLEFRMMRKSFMELLPTLFFRKVNTVIAEAWLGKVKRAFRSIQCPERYRVEVVYPLFREEAIFWWEGVERSYPAGHMISWEEFLKEFAERHYSDGDRRAKVKEFLSLEQREMTVQDFETRFHSLSRWAPEHVDTVEKKMSLFTHALHPDIQA